MENISYNLNISKFTEGEEDFFGIFISHSGSKIAINKLKRNGKKRDIDFIDDGYFLTAGEDFRRKILRCINCYAGVVIITNRSIKRDWVNYEIGLLSAYNIPVFIYDKYSILKRKKTSMFDYHIKQFRGVYNNQKDLLNDLENISVYNGLYPDNKKLSKEDFNDMLSKDCDKVMIRIESDIFEKNKDVFSNCKFKILLTNFGHYDDLINSSFRYCDDCKQKNEHCEKKVTEYKKECCLINKVLDSGKLFFVGDDNIYENEENANKTFSNATLMLHLPIHKEYGVTFKIIIDCDSDNIFEKASNILDGTCFNPTFEKRGNGGRIYLSLNDSDENGLHRCENPFNNNYLCSHSIK